MVHHMNSYKTLGEKLDANYTRMLYLGNNISSTESDVNMPIGKA